MSHNRPKKLSYLNAQEGRHWKCLIMCIHNLFLDMLYTYSQ